MKALDAFNLARGGPQGRHSYCKACRKESRDKLPVRGVTREQYDKILEAQDGVCKICGGLQIGRWLKLDIDHDHKTGEIRGLLCGNCNRGIGLLQDDPSLLRQAAIYLERK